VPSASKKLICASRVFALALEVDPNTTMCPSSRTFTS